MILRLSILFCCALAAALTSVPAPAQERLGRLFFTPAQRASLDIARSQRARAALSTEKTEEVTAAPVPQTITYSGVLRRSDGNTTVWINNQPVNDRESAGAAAIVGGVRPDGSVTLQVPQSGRSVILKPGQSVELLSGAVEEANSRKLEASRPEPKPAAKPAAEARTAKPAAPEAAAQREREERETQRLEDAISRALVETASARPGAAPSPAVPASK
jgi:hypothetical protein